MRLPSLPYFMIATVAAMTGCDSGGGSGGEVSAGEDGKINCRIGAATSFARVCTIERVQGQAGTILIIRKPDGGFRRLLVTTDGRGVVAADGAEPARVTVTGDGRIDVSVGGDHFRLPATVRR